MGGQSGEARKRNKRLSGLDRADEREAEPPRAKRGVDAGSQPEGRLFPGAYLGSKQRRPSKMSLSETGMPMHEASLTSMRIYSATTLILRAKHLQESG